MAAQGSGGDDIQFRIHYEGGVQGGYPSWVEVFSGSSGSRTEYRYEFYAYGQLITDDWYFNFRDNGVDRYDLPRGGKASFECDYGLSRGTYEVLGRDIFQVDGSLFLIMDYPMSVADFNNERGDNDPWDRHFIDPADLDAWMAKYEGELDEGMSWRHFQALRHFGMANVLFADGHLETLPPEELEETDPRWYYGGARPGRR
jgi:prepilin-type processing-associated H-X9-DG protein